MSAAAGPAYVTSIGGSGSTIITVTPTFAASNSADLKLKVPSGTTITSVSDSINGTTGWSLKAGPTTIGAASVYSYVRDGMAAGSPVVTVTLGASTTFMGLKVTVVTGTSGYDGTSTFNSQGTGAGATRASNASGTPTGSGVALGFIYNDTNNNAGAVDTGSGWAAVTGTDVTAGRFWDFSTLNLFAAEESKSYASGAQTATFTTFASSATGAIVTLFKDAAAGTAYTLSIAKANVPVVGETVTLTYSGASHTYNLSIGTALVPISMGQSFADYAIGVGMLAVPVVGKTVNFLYSPAGHNAFVLSITALAVPVVGKNVNLIYGHTLPPITCAGGSFDSLTPMPGLML